MINAAGRKSLDVFNLTALGKRIKKLRLEVLEDVRYSVRLLAQFLKRDEPANLRHCGG
jgi:hypothetical protein